MCVSVCECVCEGVATYIINDTKFSLLSMHEAEIRKVMVTYLTSTLPTLFTDIDILEEGNCIDL